MMEKDAYQTVVGRINGSEYHYFLETEKIDLKVTTIAIFALIEWSHY
ncbi:MAG: hypothetical protein WA364_27070 [Candidatus Nitrosopolaris sp.]